MPPYTIPTLAARNPSHGKRFALFVTAGRLLCSSLIAYSSLTSTPAAARSKHRHGTAAVSSTGPVYCAASKAETEATPLKDRAVAVQALKNRADEAHMTICEASHHGFAPGKSPSPAAFEAAKNVLNGAGDLVPAAFKKVVSFHSPTCRCAPKGLRRVGSVVPNGNIYYAPK